MTTLQTPAAAKSEAKRLANRKARIAALEEQTERAHRAYVDLIAKTPILCHSTSPEGSNRIDAYGRWSSLQCSLNMAQFYASRNIFDTEDLDVFTLEIAKANIFTFPEALERAAQIAYGIDPVGWPEEHLTVLDTQTEEAVYKLLADGSVWSIAENELWSADEYADVLKGEA